MKLKMYSIYDSKAQAYYKPMYSHQNGEALRLFIDALEDDKSQFYKHPGDFTIFEIGTWDDVEGHIELLAAKNNLGNGLELKKHA